ncbi:MAG: hypothetical protein ACU84Q_12060 [Gammaproteobacteria bacterium]
MQATTDKATLASSTYEGVLAGGTPGLSSLVSLGLWIAPKALSFDVAPTTATITPYIPTFDAASGGSP